MKFIKLLFPKHYRLSYRAWKILSISYGHLYTLRQLECRDSQGNPIPWYTYPAIDYLNQIDLSGKVVFEYGCGFSTLYWARKTSHVFSVDHNEEWYNRIKKMLPENATLYYLNDLDQYQNFCRVNNKMYDIIIIDGKRRYMSCLAAIDQIKEDGFIILDNADWHPNTVKLLTSKGFKRIDFIGFGPINSYTWNTGFFFKEKYSPVFFPDMPIIGNIKQTSEEDLFLN